VHTAPQSYGVTDGVTHKQNKHEHSCEIAKRVLRCDKIGMRT